MLQIKPPAHVYPGIHQIDLGAVSLCRVFLLGPFLILICLPLRLLLRPFLSLRLLMILLLLCFGEVVISLTSCLLLLLLQRFFFGFLTFSLLGGLT